MDENDRKMSPEYRQGLARLVAEHKQLQHAKGFDVQKAEAHLIDVKAQWDVRIAPLKLLLKAVKDALESGAPLPALPAPQPAPLADGTRATATAPQPAPQLKAPPNLSAEQIRQHGFIVTPAA